jgi:hypothetical protein
MTVASYGQSKSAIADTVGSNAHQPKKDSLSARDIHKMDSTTKRISFTIDSLQAKGLPTAHYQKKLDSINRKFQSYLSLQSISGKINKTISTKLNDERDSVQKKVNKKSAALQKKVKKKTSRLDSITAKAKDPTSQAKLPTANVANTSLPSQATPKINLPNSSANTSGLNLTKETNELSNLSKNLALPQSQEVKKIENELKQIENVPKQELNSTGVSKEINEAKKDAKEVSALEKKADDYKKDIKEIKKGDKEKINTLEKDAEKQVEKSATNVSEIKDLKKEETIVQTQKNAFQQYEDMVSNLKKENGLKEVKNISTKALPNPLVGQESKLQAGIAQLDKLKKKYHNIPDSRTILRRIPNEMRGKPLKVRIVPGLGFQWYPGKQTGMDLSSYLMYRLTGRLRLGLGYSDRLVFDSKNWNMSSGHVQAMRLMTDYRLIPTLNLHVEEEWTHYDLSAQNIYRTLNDPPLKEWNVKLNMGVLKSYKISRRIDGQMQLLYNTLDLSNFPQTKNTAIRFGFEYKFGVKKRNTGKKLTN